MKNNNYPLLGKHYSLKSCRTMHLNEVQKSIRDQILFKDSMSDYEVTKCRCGVEPEKDVLIAEVDRHGLPCRNVICLNCGLIRISPRWKEVRYQAFYENEYRNLYNPIGDSKETFVRKKAKTRTVQRFGTWLKAAVERYGTTDARKITVLEIGAGGGWNISKLPSEWTKIGYDVDLEYLSLGERLFGLNMRFGLLTDALKDVPQADVIILSHVVEHFMDPVVALESIAANMRPTALLLIEVPGIFRIHYTSFDPMRYLQNAHTFTFCAQTLTEILHRAGLYVLSSDQKCRVICKRSEGLKRVESDNGLSLAIIRYLKMCERGSDIRERVRRIPVLGRYLVALWKIICYPWFQFVVPHSRAVQLKFTGQ